MIALSALSWRSTISTEDGGKSIAPTTYTMVQQTDTEGDFETTDASNDTTQNTGTERSIPQHGIHNWPSEPQPLGIPKHTFIIDTINDVILAVIALMFFGKIITQASSEPLKLTMVSPVLGGSAAYLNGKPTGSYFGIIVEEASKIVSIIHSSYSVQHLTKPRVLRYIPSCFPQ
jgi:hypothetical protein